MSSPSGDAPIGKKDDIVKPLLVRYAISKLAQFSPSCPFRWNFTDFFGLLEPNHNHWNAAAHPAPPNDVDPDCVTVNEVPSYCNAVYPAVCV